MKNQLNADYSKFNSRSYEVDATKMMTEENGGQNCHIETKVF